MMRTAARTHWRAALTLAALAALASGALLVLVEAAPADTLVTPSNATVGGVAASASSSSLSSSSAQTAQTAQTTQTGDAAPASEAGEPAEAPGSTPLRSFESEADAVSHWTLLQARPEEAATACATVATSSTAEALRRGWFDAADAVLRACLAEDDGRLAQAVRTGADASKRRLDALLAQATAAAQRRAQQHSLEPAFQWAQSADSVFVNVKFAHKLDAPACIDLENLKTGFEDAKISVAASCKGKSFALGLLLYSEIVPDNCSFSFTSVGRGTFFLAKRERAKWSRLLRDDRKRPRGQMHLWHDKQEQYEAELSGLKLAVMAAHPQAAQQQQHQQQRSDGQGAAESGATAASAGAGGAASSDASGASASSGGATSSAGAGAGAGAGEKDAFELKAEEERRRVRQNAERKRARLHADAELRKSELRRESEERIHRIDEETSETRVKIDLALKHDLEQIGARVAEAREKNSVDVFSQIKSVLSELLAEWDKDEL